MTSTWIVAPRWIDSAFQNSSITSDSMVPIRPFSATLYERKGRLPRSITTRASDSSRGAYADAKRVMPARSPNACDSPRPTPTPAPPPRWCASTCRPPEPRSVMSKPPYRATCSTMWSRNGRPVATLIRPFPAMSTFAVSLVSFDLRAPSPFLIALLKPHLHCVRVRGQPFELRQPHRRFLQHLQV